MSSVPVPAFLKKSNTRYDGVFDSSSESGASIKEDETSDLFPSASAGPSKVPESEEDVFYESAEEQSSPTSESSDDIPLGKGKGKLHQESESDDQVDEKYNEYMSQRGSDSDNEVFPTDSASNVGGGSAPSVSDNSNGSTVTSSSLDYRGKCIKRVAKKNGIRLTKKLLDFVYRMYDSSRFESAKSVKDFRAIAKDKNDDLHDENKPVLSKERMASGVKLVMACKKIPECGEGFEISEFTGKCIPVCKPGKKRDPKDGRCKKEKGVIGSIVDGISEVFGGGAASEESSELFFGPKDFIHSKPRGKETKCKAGHELINGRCYLNCNADQRRNPATGKCKKFDSGSNVGSSSRGKFERPCDEGYERSLKSGKCIPVCPPGKKRNPVSGRCKTEEGSVAGSRVSVSGSRVSGSSSSIGRKLKAGEFYMEPYSPEYLRNGLCEHGYEGVFDKGVIKCKKHCPSGWERNMDTKRCRKIREDGASGSQAGSRASSAKGKVTVPGFFESIGQTFLESLAPGNKTECSDNEELINGRCYEKCPTGKFRNPDTGKCKENPMKYPFNPYSREYLRSGLCKHGYEGVYKKETGMIHCLKHCPEGKTRDAGTYACRKNKSVPSNKSKETISSSDELF